MSVVAHYAGRADRAQETVAEIIHAGGEASSFAADVADEQQVAALFDDVERATAASTSSCTPLASWCLPR
jgi:3-oxoacyl-[acyl-carrier protein] reductase